MDLTAEQASAIRQAKGRQREIAERHGTIREEVSRIKTGRVLNRRPDYGQADEECPRTLERDLLCAQLLEEFAPVLARWGIEGPDCYRRNRVVLLSALTDAVSRYVHGAYLVEPDIQDGDTLGEAIDRAADVILEARKQTA